MDGKELNRRQNQKEMQEREARLLFVASHWTRGWSLRRIADEWEKVSGLKVSHVTIMNDKDELLRQWRDENIGKTDDWVKYELECIDSHRSELYEQWDATGDVRYMAEIRQNEAERRKLLGLYGPERHEHTGANGAPLFSGMTREAAQRIIDDIDGQVGAGEDKG